MNPPVRRDQAGRQMSATDAGVSMANKLAVKDYVILLRLHRLFLQFKDKRKKLNVRVRVDGGRSVTGAAAAMAKVFVQEEDALLHLWNV